MRQYTDEDRAGIKRLTPGQAAGELVDLYADLIVSPRDTIPQLEKYSTTRCYLMCVYREDFDGGGCLRCPLSTQEGNCSVAQTFHAMAYLVTRLMEGRTLTKKYIAFITRKRRDEIVKLLEGHGLIT